MTNLVERLLNRIVFRCTNLARRISSWRMGKGWLQTTGYNSYYNGRHFTVPGCNCNGRQTVVIADSEYTWKDGTLLGKPMLYRLCDCTRHDHPSYIGIVYGNEAIADKIKQLKIKT